jgi:hypothetical protein
MSLGDSTRSATPATMALRGMESNLAVCASCTRVMPPSALMALSPSTPSEAEPDSSTPTARPPWSPARERRKKSMVLWREAVSPMACTVSAPLSSTRLALGGPT